MSLNVLYLRSSFEPGGTESLLLNVFNYPQDKIRFHYVLLKDGTLIKQLRSAQNKYYLMFRNKSLDLKVIIRLLQLIDSEQIQMVHSHQLIELVYAILLKILRRRLRIFHTVHGYHDRYWPLVLERFLVRFTHKTFTVSEATKGILVEKGYLKKKIKVLSNAVNEVSQNKKRISLFQHKLNITSKEIIIGMIGNFVWWKDQLTIIRAFNDIREKHQRLKLVFIGKKTEIADRCIKEVLPEDYNRRVFFMGSLKDANEVLSLFDLFIMSTTADTFGIAVVESILAGVPVLASDIEPMKELSENGKYFPLFKTGDSNNLASKLEPLLKNEKLTQLRESVVNSQEYFIIKYSFKNYCNKLCNLYNSSTNG